MIALRISDYNTVGLTGADTCAIGTNWSRLVKESGSSNKGATSGGSFGIGKYASFACSQIRTVFFSSLDADGVESSIGVTRLVSFRDEEHGGRITTGIGYYSDNESNIACMEQLNLPCAKKRKQGESGTDIYVLGFRNRVNDLGADGNDNRFDDVVFAVLRDFLVSLWKGQLVVRFVNSGKSVEINRKTLGAFINLINPNTEDEDLRNTVNHYQLLSNVGSSAVHVVDFDPSGVTGAKKFKWKQGDCKLYFMEGENLNRRVMITRAAGMRLFDKGHVSGSLNFTGILMIEGETMNKDFREMEAPSHDSWSPELAQDSGLADRKMKALNKWINNTIVETLSKPIEDSVDAYGISLFLPQGEDAAEQADEGFEGDTREIVEFKVKTTTPKRQDPKTAEPVGVEPDSGGAAVRKGKKAGKGKGRNGGTAPGDKDGFQFIPVRQRLTGAGKLGLYQVRVDIPRASEKAQVRISLRGEKDSFAAKIVSAEVVGGKAQVLDIKDNKITFGPVSEGEALTVRFNPGFDQYCQMGVDYYAAE